MSEHKCMKCIHGSVCGDFEGSHSKNCEYFLPESEWISVKDRLPTQSGYYLVCCENPHRGRQNGVDVSYYQHKVQNWKAIYNPAVAYWMPLPEPPKENAND